MSSSTKTLDCTSTPNAIITTINGGRANYSYNITNSSSVVVDSGTGITGTTYSPVVAGTYTIQITDANSCTTTTSATVAPITTPNDSQPGQVVMLI
jgi:hypothetical protein